MTWALRFLTSTLLQNMCYFCIFFKITCTKYFLHFCYMFLILHSWLRACVIIVSEKCVEHVEGIWSQKYYLKPNSISAKSTRQISSINVEIKWSLKRVFYLNTIARHPISRLEKHIAIYQKCIRAQIVSILLIRSPMLQKIFFSYFDILV